MIPTNLQATRSEQYLDAVERAQIALTVGNLELAVNCINAAQHVKYDMELRVIEIEKGE